MGSLDQIARTRAQGRQTGQSAGGGGSLDRIAAQRKGGVAGIPVLPAPPAEHHGRGLLSELGHVAQGGAHWLGQKAELAATDLKNIPGGLVQQAEVSAPVIADVLGGQLPTHKELSAYGKSQKGIVTSTVATVHHPLRDPFQTGLLVVGALSGVGGAAGRLAEAGRAIDTGGSFGDVVKAATSKPPVRPRLLSVNGEPVSLHASKNPTVRAVQAIHDRIIQHAIDTNPEGRVASYGTKRVGGSIDETARRQARMRAAPASVLARASVKLTGPVKKLTGAARVHQAALELTSTNTAPEAAAAFHDAQATAGVNAERNRVVAKLYKAVAKKQLLTTNEHGDVIVDAAKHPDLAKADVALAAVQGKGDEILARYGVRTPEQLQARVDAPARVRAGATYENPTRGKLGLPTVGLKNAQKRAVSLEGRVARSQAGGLRSIPEAQARLAALEQAHNAALDKVAGGLFGEINPAEVRFRNRENARALRQQSGVDRAGRASGSSGAKSTLRPTVKNEMRAQAEARIERAIAANPEHPFGKRWQARANEIDQLQQALHPDIFEKVNRRDLGRVGTPTDPRRHAELEGALAVAKRDLATAEKTAANRVTPTGLVGGETARPGRGFVSYKLEEKRTPRSSTAGSPGPVVGETRSPIGSRAFTGEGVEKGFVPKDITGPAARNFQHIVRFVNTSERRAQAIRMGSAVKRTGRDVLVRVPGVAHEKIPATVNDILGTSRLTTDDVNGLHAALEAFRQELVPGLRDRFAQDHATGIGTAAPKGHVFVDRNLLGELARSTRGPRGVIGRQVDNVNSAVTAATVYFKIGHVGTRVLTNAVTNIIQGSAAPLEIRRANELWHAISDEERARALAAAGEHGFTAMPHEGVSLASRVAGKGANWWARHVDAPFRFNALAYEARKAGFTTPEQFRYLLNKLEDPTGLDAAQTAKVDWVGKRANREAIAYDRLSPGEKQYLAGAIWFYPWVRSTANFLANTITEHPYKAAAAGVLAKQSETVQQRELGDLPSYERGLIKLAGGAKPLVADFSTFSPFATPADTLDVGSVGQASSLLNPVYAALAIAATRQNQFGQHTNQPIQDAFSELFSPTPEAQIVSGFANRHHNQSRKMFPASPALAGTLSPLVRALVGPGAPRRINLPAAARAAARERSGR